MKSEHSKKPKASPEKCDQCAFIAEDVPTLITHIRTVHVGTFCQYCDYVAHDKENLRNHVFKYHEDVIMMN